MPRPLRFLSLFVVALAACKNSTGPRPSFTAPLIAPEINKVLPSALRSSNTSALRAPLLLGGGMSNAVAPATLGLNDINGLFTGNYAVINSGAQVQGFINANVLNVDGRMRIIQNQIMGMEHQPLCLTNTTSPYTIDLSAIDPMLRFTLNNISCSSAMNSGNATGSGVLFGRSGNNYSILLSLGQLGTGTFTQLGGFMVAANITDYQGPNETIDGMFIEYFPPSRINRTTAVRFKVTQSTQTFEVTGASTQASMGGVNTGADLYLGAGFRMISDGTRVYADGLVYDASVGLPWQNFSSCMSGSPLALTAATSDCTALAGSFTFANGGGLRYGGVSGSGITALGSIPAPTTNLAQPSASATVVNALQAAFSIANAASITTDIAVMATTTP